MAFTIGLGAGRESYEGAAEAVNLRQDCTAIDFAAMSFGSRRIAGMLRVAGATAKVAS
jgi:hypothetical protein